MKKITSANYTKDQLYPVVARVLTEILKTETVVTPVDVLVRMQRLTKQQVEDWRFGRIPYLERVVLGNLSPCQTDICFRRRTWRGSGLSEVPAPTEQDHQARRKPGTVCGYRKPSLAERAVFESTAERPA